MRAVLLSLLISFAFITEVRSQCQPIIISNGYPIIVDTQCGEANGVIEILADGNGTITYSLNGAPFQASGRFIDLPANNHVITMMDSAGCTENISIPLSNQSEITNVSVTVTNASCGSNNGRITVNATGTGLTYQLDGGAAQSSNVFPGLTIGNYSITITDVNGCTEVTSALVRRDGIQLLSESVTDTDCPGSTGQIIVNASGTGTVQYSINNGPFTTSGTFTGLASGNYTIRIQDASGCTLVRGFVVNANIMYTTSVLSAVCGVDNGQITFNVTTPGTFEYSIDNGANYSSSNVFMGLSPANYTIRIRETNNGCLVRDVVEVMEEVTITNIMSSSTLTDCTVDNGSVTVSATGSGLTYSIDGGATSNTTGVFTGLASGDYTVIINDDRGCSMDEMVSVGVNTSVTINNLIPTISDCNSPTGSLTIDAIGIGTLQYSIDDGTSFQSSNVFMGLLSGTYNVVVTDANGCSASMSVLVPESNDINVTGFVITSPTNACSGDGSIVVSASGSSVEFSIDNVNFQPTGVFNNLDAGIYIIYMRNVIGCTKETGEIELTGLIDITDVAITPTTCRENTGTLEITAIAQMIEYSLDNTNFQNENIFTDLAAGDYTVYVRDENGCVNDSSVTILNSGFTQITSVVPTTTICGEANGTITINGTSESGTFEYSIDGTNYGASNLFENLASGTYTAFLRDEFNCISQEIVSVPESEDIVFDDLVTTDEVCDGMNGTVEVMVSGGNGNFQYSLNGGGFQTSNVFRNLVEGDYTVDVLDEIGCQRQELFSLINSCTVGIATAITPNGNGVNDKHKLIFGAPLEVKIYQVFNIWGEMVWETDNFISTDNTKWWDGFQSGELIPGAYLYRIEYTFEGEEVKKEGTVTVIK